MSLITFRMLEKRRFGLLSFVACLFIASVVCDAQEPASWRDSFKSREIERLRQQVLAGNTNTERFWQDIASKGTPLVEPSAPDAKHQVVTFLWRGSSDTKNVLVELYPFTWERAGDYVMKRVDRTDVWYLTVRLPHGARFVYRLSPNDPLDNPASGILRRTRFQADPLNPNRWLCDAASPIDRCLSRVELPGAVPQPWVAQHPEIPAGKVETLTFKSDQLKNERTVAVYTPPGYVTDSSSYPMVLLFDGATLRSSLIPTPTILDNLIAAHTIPPTVAVFVSNPPGQREAELLFNRTFVDAVSTELVPWVRERYRISTNPALMVIGGVSAGGTAAMYTALLHPDVFGNVLAQSASFNSSPEQLKDFTERAPIADNSDRHVQEEVEDRELVEGGWLMKQVLERPRLPIRFYVDAGLFEVSDGGVVGILDGTRYMRDVLLAKGYEVHYQMFIGGHDYLSWRGTIADGLIALLGKKTAQ